jgi:ribonucleotide reductase alpha subunit
MNRLNNLYYCEFINATNPCLTGETKVYVADGRGYVTIKELANEGKDVPVFCYDNNKKIVIKMMRNPRITGYNQKIYKVTLDDGNVIRTTGNHKFKLKNGEYKEVANLSYGDSLDILLRDEDLKEHKYIADFHYNTDLNIGDIYHKDNNKLNNNINNLFIDSETLSNEALISHTKILIDNLNRLFTYDEWIQYCENNNILDFYYNWSKNNNSSILSLGKYSMIDMGLIQETNDEYKYYLSMGYDCFIENNVIKFNKVCENTKKSFVTVKPEHMVLEKSNISYSTYNEYYSTPFTDIVSIEEDGFENVYNGTVDEYHNFFVGGFETTNEFGKPCFVNLNNLQCGEQVLPIGAVCLLGSINLTQFIDYDNKTWNFEKLKEIIPIAVRLMDNVNDVTKVPLEIQQQNLKDKRRIGLGIMGYGSALMMLKIKYGSPEALKITEDLMQFIANTAYQASSDIALEKGSFTLFDMDKYLAGNFVKNLSSETIEKIRKQGLRNSHLLSIQPTGNSSILANIVSGGLEPIFMPEYKRTSIMPYPPNGLDIPHNIDWVNKTYTSNTK